MPHAVTLGAALIVSKDPARLAGFYRDVFGLEFDEESHPDAPGLHYGCQLGKVHFAIHPPENFAAAPECAPGGVRLAFGVDEIHGYAERLASRHADALVGPEDLGWSWMIGCRDPDGNYLELVQLKRIGG